MYESNRGIDSVARYPEAERKQNALNRQKTCPLLVGAIGDSHLAIATATVLSQTQWKFDGDYSVPWTVAKAGRGFAMAPVLAVSGQDIKDAFANLTTSQEGLFKGGTVAVPDILMYRLMNDRNSNDTPQNLWRRMVDGAENLRRHMVKQGRAGIIFWLGPKPTSDTANAVAVNTFNYAIRSFMEEYAKANGDLFFDPYTVLADSTTDTSAETLPAYIGADAYHFNAAGNRAEGEAMAAILAAAFPNAPSMVTPTTANPKHRVAASTNTGTTYVLDENDGYDWSNLLPTGDFRDNGRVVSGSGTTLDRFVNTYGATTETVFSIVNTNELRMQLTGATASLKTLLQMPIKTWLAGTDFDTVQAGDWLLCMLDVKVDSITNGSFRMVPQFYANNDNTGASGGDSLFDQFDYTTDGEFVNCAALVKVPASVLSLQWFIQVVNSGTPSCDITIRKPACINLTRAKLI